MGLEEEEEVDEELDKYALSEAVHELYEDLTTRVGKELHAVINGKYIPPKRPPSPTKSKDKRKPSSPSPAPSTPSPSSPSPNQEWNMTPWRPKSPSKKKKKKTVKVQVVRRPFGPVGSMFPLNEEGDVLYLDTLLSPWGCPVAVNWCDPTNKNTSPIILAASLGKVFKETMVESLLKREASVFARTSNGNTALHQAAKGGHTPIVLILLAAGSEVDAENVYGNTPLSSAVRNGHRDVSEILVMVGANIDLKNKQNESPLDRSDDADLKTHLKLKRNKFLVASQKRIMIKSQEVQAALESQKQQRLRLKQEQKAASAEDAEASLSSDESEKEDQDGGDEEEVIEVPVVSDTVPVMAIIAEFQLTLAKRTKLAQKNRTNSKTRTSNATGTTTAGVANKPK